MELFRSKPMQYVSLTVAADAAYDTMRDLGKFGKFHVVDLNENAAVPTDFFLFHKKRVVVTATWERKLKRFEELMREHQVQQVPAFDAAENDPVLEGKSGDFLVDIKNYLEPLEIELNRNIEYKTSEVRRLNELHERHVVLEAAKARLFQMDPIPDRRTGVEIALTEMHDADDLKRPLMSVPGELPGLRLDVQSSVEDRSRFHNYVCGVMPALQQSHFDRMLFRLSRGNAFARYFELEEPIRDPATNEKVKKVVFYVAVVGQQVGRRVEKMCDYFRATRYDVPEHSEDIDAQMDAISRELEEKRQVVARTSYQITQILNRVAHDDGFDRVLGVNGIVGSCNSPLRIFQEAMRREKIISDTLKKVVVNNGSRMMRCEGWCPQEELDRLHAALQDSSRNNGSQPAIVQYPANRQRPPTYFKLNKFTSTFQGIVDTYGVPRYQEVNPGLFTIVTFPFLFGVMYGDIGHGTILFFFSLYLLINEKKFEAQVKARTMPELLGMAFGGRYMLFCMSLFAIYSGFVYNDCMSVPINFFGSSWEFGNTTMPNSTIIQATGPSKTYPFGIDPYWFNTKNELTFFNSLKMKLAVTLGVIHMTFGIMLSLFNHIYFGNYVSIYCEFIPQLLFFLSIFGYMIFLIIIKMCTDWSSNPSLSPPSLIQVMIKMFLSPGSVPKDQELYPNQGLVQVALVLLAVACIPWMLFPKPYIERAHHNNKKRLLASSMEDPHASSMGARSNGPYSALPEDATGEHKESSDMHRVDLHVAAKESHGSVSVSADHGGHGEEEEEFVFSEHMIHQTIHTIEFVLGAVSNTASYLRLWALSLAHAELASVFWDKMILSYGVNTGKFYMTFVAMAVWIVATVGVLCAMDVLECFLHALRLHWVEFQNKFFQADGYAFVPFSFEVVEEE